MPVFELSDGAFDNEVLESPVPVLVDVWADWCAPCKALEPVMQQLAEHFGERARIGALDADANLETVTQYGVRSLPTLLLFDRGVLVERLTGAQSLGTLRARLESIITQQASGAAPVVTRPPSTRPGSSAEAVAMAEALIGSDEPTVVFKHSPTCSISLSVKREYDAFVAAHPDVPARVVIVQTERPLSNALEEITAIRHESPQAFLVRNGRVLWHASHRRITASALSQALNAAQVTPRAS